MSVIFDRVKTLCNRDEMSLAELERELRFSKGSLHKWQTSSPSVDKLEAVAKYFMVAIEYLLGRTDDSIDYNDQELLQIIGEDLIKQADGNVKKAWKWRMARNSEMNDEPSLHLDPPIAEIAAASSTVPYEDLPPEALEELEKYKELLRLKYGKK